MNKFIKFLTLTVAIVSVLAMCSVATAEQPGEIYESFKQLGFVNMQPESITEVYKAVTIDGIDEPLYIFNGDGGYTQFRIYGTLGDQAGFFPAMVVAGDNYGLSEDAHAEMTLWNAGPVEVETEKPATPTKAADEDAVAIDGMVYDAEHAVFAAEMPDGEKEYYAYVTYDSQEYGYVEADEMGNVVPGAVFISSECIAERMGKTLDDAEAQPDGGEGKQVDAAMRRVYLVKTEDSMLVKAFEILGDAAPAADETEEEPEKTAEEEQEEKPEDEPTEEPKPVEPEETEKPVQPEEPAPTKKPRPRPTATPSPEPTAEPTATPEPEPVERTEVVVTTEAIPYTQKREIDENLYSDDPTYVAQAGEDGEYTIETTIVYLDDVEVSRSETSRTITKEMVPEIVKYGVRDHEYKIESKDVEAIVSYTTETRNNAELPEGTRNVIRSGIDGKTIFTYQITYKDGEEVHRELVQERVIVDMVPEIVEVGTKVVEEQPETPETPETPEQPETPETPDTHAEPENQEP